MGYVAVKCIETGKRFPSTRSAAREMFGHNGNGRFIKATRSGDPYKGYHFEILGAKREKNESLCWLCKNTNALLCSWFNPDNKKPVKGWVVAKKEVKVDGRYADDYFIVRSCPNFVKEERINA